MDRAKDEFYALLGHELRNSLASVRSAVQIMRLIGLSDPKLQHARDIIDRQVSYIVRLVDDLVDVSRITRGMLALQIECLRLHDVLAKAVENAQPLIERKEHVLRIELPQDAIWVDADETRLIQAVTNVLLNAAHYTPSELNDFRNLESGWDRIDATKFVLRRKCSSSRDDQARDGGSVALLPDDVRTASTVPKSSKSTTPQLRVSSYSTEAC